MKLLSDSSPLTVEGCIKLAAAANYTYAGVQFSYQCFGGNDISQYIGQGTCRAPCSGNSSQICGGNCTNAIYMTKISVAADPAPVPGRCSVLVKMPLTMTLDRSPL
jgi:hypothetical protein